MYFTITTSREVALSIVKQIKFEENLRERSFKLGDVNHYVNFSSVQIIPAKDGQSIDYSEIFWLGHFSQFRLDAYVTAGVANFARLCPLCSVPSDLHGTCCGWINASVTVTNDLIVTDGRHPGFGKNLDMWKKNELEKHA